MERGRLLPRTRAGCRQGSLLSSSPLHSELVATGRSRRGSPFDYFLTIRNQLPSMPSLVLGPSNARRRQAIEATFYNEFFNIRTSSKAYCVNKAIAMAWQTVETVDLDWDNLGFGLVPTDFMYVMKCSQNGSFSKGEFLRFGPIELSPSSGVLNYGQGLFEGLKAYRKEDGSVILFRPQENALRMRMGAERLCMPSPTIDQFVDAIKLTVLANKRWVPPARKGSLYIRPLLIGSGAVLGVSPAPEYTFLVFVSPVGSYFKEGLAPINLVVENEHHRAAPGGTGDVKVIGNYAARNAYTRKKVELAHQIIIELRTSYGFIYSDPFKFSYVLCIHNLQVLKAQNIAKENGYSDVLYLDSVHKQYLEEVSSCNIFIVKNKIISTPQLKGTILPGITRKSIIDVARDQGYQVEERPIRVEELLDADEVFCTGTAVVVSPVGSITYLERRVEYGNMGVGVVSQQLYSALTRLQTGLSEDTMGWTMQIN